MKGRICNSYINNRHEFSTNIFLRIHTPDEGIKETVTLLVVKSLGSNMYHVRLVEGPMQAERLQLIKDQTSNMAPLKSRKTISSYQPAGVNILC